MDERDITCTNLNGQICPYPIIRIVREVHLLSEGEQAVFLVDDPLAIKAVPEEFEDYDDILIDIERRGKGQWRITVTRDA